MIRYDAKCPDARPEGELLSAGDIARILKISTRTAARMAADGRIPGAVRIGAKLLRFDRAAVLKWIAAGCKNNSETN